MAKSVWPYDSFPEPVIKIDEKSLNRLVCFVISPISDNKERWDDLLELIRHVCKSISEALKIPIEVVRADEITSAGVIHTETWHQIRSADVIIADITGQNGNVMLELGVAAAWRKKEEVIIMRESKPDERILFDINPARHIEYKYTFKGIQKLSSQLREVISNAIGTAPFTPLKKLEIKLPLKAQLDQGKDFPELFTPDITHRVVKDDCLEFGSLYIYPNSWMSVGNLKIRNVKVEAKLRFNLRRDYPAFMGVMLRAQHFYANYGHLVYIGYDGKITRTVPEDDKGKYKEDRIGELKDFNPDDGKFIDFKLEFDETSLRINIGSFSKEFLASEMPYVFTRGRIFFIAGFCRVGINKVRVEQL